MPKATRAYARTSDRVNRLVGRATICLIFAMTGLFIVGVTSPIESSAVGVAAATLATLVEGCRTCEVKHGGGEKIALWLPNQHYRN